MVAYKRVPCGVCRQRIGVDEPRYEVSFLANRRAEPVQIIAVHVTCAVFGPKPSVDLPF